MSQSDSDPHVGPKPPTDHELTPLETYFDELFNEHMVLPQPPEETPPIEGVDGQEAVSANRHGR